MRPRSIGRFGSGTLPVAFAIPAGFRESHSRPLAEGEVIASTYVIRDEVARSPTGVVFSARDMMLNRPVALKFGWRDRGSPSLLVEARRCASVVHACAVQIHGAGAHNGVEYVVGERVEGQLLQEAPAQPLTEAGYLKRLRAVIEAVAWAHNAGVALGVVSGATVLVAPDGRVVLGQLSLSQVPAHNRHGQVFAPEVICGDAQHSPVADDASLAIDLYALGCTAIEMAQGFPLFAAEDPHVEARRHVLELPPKLTELRPEFASELSELVDWLLAKNPAARPRSATDVLLQLDAIAARLGPGPRTLRVLVVDHDIARARWLWSLARRAHPAALIEIAGDGPDAAHKLNRDQPDLVFVEAGLRGVMNALEFCTYARSVEGGSRSEIFVVGDVTDRDEALLAEARASRVPDGASLANAILDRVRVAVREAPKNRWPRSTVSG